MRAKKRGDSYRVQVFSHYEGNKRKYASFTAPTKALAEMKAAEFMASKKRRARHDLTIGDAVEGYISAKKAVLSPSTVRSYKQMVAYYAPLSKRKISTLTSEDIQRFISSLTVSPKTVRNIYSLLTSSIALYDPDITFRVTLPAKQIKRPVSPSDDDIRLLYNNASDKLKVCIYLGVKGLRRGEICALKYEDINNGVAHIHADMVKGTDGKWIYKEIPKTSESDRYISVDIGEGEGFVVDWTPDSITKRFIELRDRVGLSVRFHDLRHYFASSAALIMPDIYAADLGGWRRGSKILKGTYQNNIKPMSEYYEKKYDEHIDSIIGSR